LSPVVTASYATEPHWDYDTLLGLGLRANITVMNQRPLALVVTSVHVETREGWWRRTRRTSADDMPTQVAPFTLLKLELGWRVANGDQAGEERLRAVAKPRGGRRRRSRWERVAWEAHPRPTTPD
jgi:hypothetical protein